MTKEARALTNVLLAHHRRTTQQHPPNDNQNADQYVITYGDLCNLVKAPHLTRIIGRFLLEVAEWCEQNHWPPLNALAVNAESRIPGDSYNGAGGFTATDWPRDVRACIEFEGYPAMAPGGSPITAKR